MKRIFTILLLMAFVGLNMMAYSANPEPYQAKVTMVYNVTQNGGSNGSIVLTFTGESSTTYSVMCTGPSTYESTTTTGISEGEYTITDLPAGKYTITVSDGTTPLAPFNQTIEEPAAEPLTNVDITEPDAITASIGTVTDVTCRGASEGSIVVEDIAGGVSPATYIVSWSEALGGTAGTQEVPESWESYTISGLPAGTYTITITDENDCAGPDLAPQTIDEPGELTAGTIAGALITCSGVTETHTITSPTLAAGGTDTESERLYSWEKSTDPNFASPVGTVIEGATGETYTLTDSELKNTTGAAITTYYRRVVTNGCNEEQKAVTDAVEITVNPLPSANINTVATDALCATGSDQKTSIELGLTTVGSIATSWTWSIEEGDEGSLAQETSSTPTFTTGAAGTTTINVALSDGTCSTTATLDVITNDLPTVTVSPASTSVCFGATATTINATPAGGTSYTYKWNENTSYSDDASYTTANDLTVGEHEYNVQVRDEIGCSSADAAVSTITVDNMPTVTITGDNALCLNESSTLTVTETTGAFVWETVPATTTAAGLPAANTTNPIEVTPTAAGIYEYKVTRTLSGSGTNSCSASATMQVEVYALPAFTATAGTARICHEASTGSITLDFTQGASPYAIDWTNDATIVNSDVSASYTRSDFVAGTYNIVVTDDHNCKSVSVEITLEDVPALVAGDISANQFVCYNAPTAELREVTATENLVGTAQYQWLSSTSENGTYTNATGSSTAMTYEPGQLTATTYYKLKVTDATCGYAIETEPITITVNPELTYTVSNTTLNCNGDDNGKITLTVEGGTANYNAEVSGQTTQTDVASPIRFEGLTAGSYDIKVTDSKGCVAKNASSVSE